MNNKTIAIITARGGSKRIPRKNIKNFLGKPIIAYSIEAALNSKIFDEVMVSTDDKEIAEISKHFGAKIPFIRSKETSDDYATTTDVILEVINKYKSLGREFDYGCCIYPTAPFINSERLCTGYNLLKNSGASSAIPVVNFSYPIERALKIDEKNKLCMIYPENVNKTSQSFVKTYHDAGQYYWFKTSDFLRDKNIFANNTVAIILPETEVQDIDTLDDWKVAELKYKILNICNKECVRLKSRPDFDFGGGGDLIKAPLWSLAA